MPTSNWSIPTGKAITGATYIKDTDDYIAATIEDLVDWCNNANGTYTDWTLTGLRTDFVDVDTAQTITAVKTVDTLGAIDFTGGELRIGGTAVTSTASELNILDGVTSTTSELNILDGVTATAADLNKTSSITSGTYAPTLTNPTNSVVSSPSTYNSHYIRIGDEVTVSGMIAITPSSAGRVTVEISLPIASNLTSTSPLTGVVFEPVSGGGYLFAQTTNDTAVLDFDAVSTIQAYPRFTFSYTVA